MSIRSRLAVAYGVGVIVTLVVVGAVVWWQMGAALEASLVTTLETRAAGIVTAIENTGQPGLQDGDQTAPGTFAMLFSSDGVLVDSTSSAPSGVRPVDGVFSIAGHEFLVRTLRASDGTVVVTGADLQPIVNSQAALARLLLLIGAVVSAASLCGGWVLAGRALRPVDRLIEHAATLGPADLGRRLAPPARMDEVGQLTVTLNQMLDRIAESVERQRVFVAMASHELRTPLASLRAELDIADRDGASLDEYRQAVREAHGDAVRLTYLATSLLELATTQEDARQVDCRLHRLREVVAAVVRGVDPLAHRASVTIDLDVPNAVFTFDGTRIEHALGNLLANAVVHGGRERRVLLRCQIEGEPGARTMLVEVLDEGPGLGGDAPERLFEPFVRGSLASRGGSGLGLATVANAVVAHGGTFGAANRPGGGARFWFTIPEGGAALSRRTARRRPAT